ncbi:MAG: retroviral-like aspartic protease family protein [Bacteroidales bacterium]|nr:retroviral-like aspartic protease family protein [Bacteroidales bacterium]
MIKKIYKIKLKVFKLDGGGRHIAVKAQINGHSAVLLVDTGASNSIFDSGHIAFAQTILNKVDSDGNSSGFNSEISNLFQGEVAELKISRYKVNKVKVIFTSMDHINALYKSLRFPVIAGIIGCDWLIENSAILDFSQQILTIEKKSH